MSALNSPIRKIFYPFNPAIPLIHNDHIITRLEIGDWVEDLGSGKIYQLQKLPLFHPTNTLRKLILIGGLFWTEFHQLVGAHMCIN